MEGYERQEKLFRVKTKILERDDEFSIKYPILFPSKHLVVNCQIQESPLKKYDAGFQAVGSILRGKYWIICSRRNIRRQVSKCLQL